MQLLCVVLQATAMWSQDVACCEAIFTGTVSIALVWQFHCMVHKLSSKAHPARYSPDQLHVLCANDWKPAVTLTRAYSVDICTCIVSSCCDESCWSSSVLLVQDDELGVLSMGSKSDNMCQYSHSCLS